MIILDFGSGNTCKNDLNYVKRMIDELKAVDTGKHEVVIKWQLFEWAGDNIPLEPAVFHAALHFARRAGYKTTASVFDKQSLIMLLQYDIPFVKIANRPDLYWLAGEVPRKMPVYLSVPCIFKTEAISKVEGNVIPLLCVSKYPATINDYE